jgi:beta-phosphoglucomutase-like phosphatase (HAD superfamily)
VNDNKMETFYVLDLDRTLFDTERAVTIMEEVVAIHDQVLARALRQRFCEYSERGESFSVRDFIVDMTDEANMQFVEARYHEAAQAQDLLLPGAKELIAFVRSRPRTRFGILTYGSPQGQAMKMRAAVGLEEVPFLVTAGRHKGEQIAQWQQADGTYRLPEELGGVIAREMVFVDDKSFSFTGFPPDGTGYQVRGVAHVNDEPLPPHVTLVANLAEVVSLETARLSL